MTHGVSATHEHCSRLARNNALVYTVGPNGNQQRYKDDVHELPPTVEAWHARMRLLGRNVAKSVAAYNALVAERSPDGLLPIIVARTCFIAGGAFRLQDPAGKSFVSLQDRAASYQQGLLDVFRRSSAASSSRVRPHVLRVGGPMCSHELPWSFLLRPYGAIRVQSEPYGEPSTRST